MGEHSEYIASLPIEYSDYCETKKYEKSDVSKIVPAYNINEDVAKYQKDVDEVFLFEKRGKNKGFWGIIKFIASFPYKKINYVIRLHNTTRVKILSWLLSSRKLYAMSDLSEIAIQERNANTLKNITHREIHNYPITYFVDKNLSQRLQSKLQPEGEYIALCVTSTLLKKDMPLETTVGLINILNEKGYNVNFTGNGIKADKCAMELSKCNCNFINLVNQTTIYELAQVLSNCKTLISIDTGTMHFGYANKVPTVCIFYDRGSMKYWAPKQDIYPYTIIPEDLSAEGIYKSFKELQEKYLNKEEL